MPVFRWIPALAVLVLAGQAPAEATQGSGSQGGSSAAADAGNRVSVGFHMSATYFPSSSRKVPGRSSLSQTSGLFGGQLELGFLHERGIRILGLLRTGYVAAGEKPGNGDDGMVLGFGGDVGYTALGGGLKGVEPFARIVFDRKLTQFSQNEFGTLADGATFVAIGARLLKGVFELSLGAGGDYSGGTAALLGLGIGTLY